MEKTKVLLVDDEPEFRESAARVLRRRGFMVDTAENGKRALQYLESNLPDIVVLDLKMEEMDGLTALKMIRQLYGDLPVIILTGHGDYKSALATIKMKILEFLQKPVDIDILAEKITRLLTLKRQATLAEKTVTDLMIPVDSYDKVFTEQSVREVLRVLKAGLIKPLTGEIAEKGHRSVLVMDADGSLVSILRFMDIIEMIPPDFLRESPYSSYFTGMFLAQCKVIGDKPIGLFIDPEEMITINDSTTLMEATVLMSQHNLINLPVMHDGKLVGILRDRDIFLEIYSKVVGD